MPEIDAMDPWWNTGGKVHEARAAMRRRLITKPETDAERRWNAWIGNVTDRAFFQCFEYKRPDELAPFLVEAVEQALVLSGPSALHAAQTFIEIKALALGIPERDW